MVMPVDPAAYVAPTARVHADAVIGPHCHIGEFCVVEQNVEIGPHCRLDPYVCIKRWTTLGGMNELSSGVVLGTDPLDKNFKGDRSYLRIGHSNKIREQFTISRGTKREAATVIGDNNFIMTSGHIAHDCQIGDDNTIASCALLAGYVEIENRVFISGGVVVHQYSKIGKLAMVGGNSRVNLDLPPFLMYSDFNASPKGLNMVGLRRAEFSVSEVTALKTAYKLLYRSRLRLEEALQAIETQIPTDNTLHLVRFIRASRRGITRE